MLVKGFPNFGMRVRCTAAILLIALCGLVACQPGAATTQETDPQHLLNAAEQNIQQTRSVKIKLQVSGAPTFVNTVGTGMVQFLSADGEYLAPSSISAAVKAKLLGVVGEVDIVEIGNAQWYRNKMLTGGKFLNCTFAPGLNLAQQLLSSDQGIKSALQSITDLTLVGQENRYGTHVYHLVGNAPGVRVTSLTVGLIQSNSTVTIDIYIDTATLHAIEMILTQPETVNSAEPIPTSWDLELYDYDVPVTITPPPNEISIPLNSTLSPTTQPTDSGTDF